MSKARMLAFCGGAALLLLGSLASAGHRPLILYTPVHAYEGDRVNLKRLVRRYHGVDLHGYALRSVALHTSGRHSRHSEATLRVGPYVTHDLRTRKRRPTLTAPGTVDGPWKLQVGYGLAVNAVTVVLDPKPGYARHHRSRSRDHYAYNDHRRDGYHGSHRRSYDRSYHRSYDRKYRKHRREHRRWRHH